MKFNLSFAFTKFLDWEEFKLNTGMALLKFQKKLADKASDYDSTSDTSGASRSWSSRKQYKTKTHANAKAGRK